MKITNFPSFVKEHHFPITTISVVIFLVGLMVITTYNSPNRLGPGIHVFIDGYNVKGIVNSYSSNGETEVLIFENGKPTKIVVKTFLLKRDE